jgi:hypothetical protein
MSLISICWARPSSSRNWCSGGSSGQASETRSRTAWPRARVADRRAGPSTSSAPPEVIEAARLSQRCWCTCPLSTSANRVHDERDRLARAGGLLLNPGPLRVLSGEAGAEELRVDAEHSPAACRGRPWVRAYHLGPQALLGRVDRIVVGPVGWRVVADVVVAGDGAPWRRQAVELAAAELKVARVASTVQAQVTKMNDEVGRGCGDRLDHGFPVRLSGRRGRRQVTVG